jgi:hypothetical protein
MQTEIRRLSTASKAVERKSMRFAVGVAAVAVVVVASFSGSC